MAKKIIFYGAGEHAAKILGDNPLIKAMPAPPPLEDGVCFVDIDVKKHGTFYLNLPVVSPETALAEYGRADIYITIADYETNHGICQRLIQMGVDEGRIINGARLSCPYLENFIVCGYHEGAFDGKAGYDSGSHSLKSCCSDYGKNSVAFIPIGNDLAESFCEFIKLRDDTINRLNKGEPTKCDGCIELKFWPRSSEFSYVIFNELGVCNCKCEYCNYEERLGRDTSADTDFIQLMKLVASYGFDANGMVELCNGEITIHPQKKAFYEAVKGYRVMFLTNGLIYDEFIQSKLEDGSGILNLSIDCGTRETFKKVKGIDGFDRVVRNLKQYARNRKGVLNLKFIVLPGVNDNFEDIDGFIKLCLELDATNAHISHNLCLSYKDYDTERTASAVCYMLNKLKESSVPFEIYSKNVLDKIVEAYLATC
jgi:wyosine [tRNA(Phe)-imidazoG37] synthetase (radical SAM superfamily)